MKSKQINFFILPEDISEINDFLIKKGCLISKGNIKNMGDDIGYEIVSNPEKIFQVYLFREKDWDRIQFKYLEEREYYYLHILRSYSIEFGIGGFYPYSDKELHRSRFYYNYEYFQDNAVIKKDIDFINWADNIFKEFKKKFLQV